MAISVAVINGMTNATDEDLSALQTDTLVQQGVMSTVQYSTPLSVTATGTPDKNSNVAAGVAYIPNSTSLPAPFYRVLSDSTVTTLHSDTAGNPRIDAVVLFLDLSAAPNADATNVATIEVIEGTEAGAPTTPSDGDIDAALGANTWFRLADIAIANPFVSIVGANITDHRPFAYIDGGKVAASNQTDSYGFINSTGERTLYKKMDLNGNLVTYHSDGTIVEIFVPLTGDIQSAINTSAGTAPIILAPGTFTPSDQIDITDDKTHIRGSGFRSTNISASGIGGANKAVFKITDASNVNLENLRIGMSGSGGSVTDGILVDADTANVNFFHIRDVGVSELLTGQTGFRTISNAGSILSISTYVLSLNGTAGQTPTGFTGVGILRGRIDIYVDVDAGTHWTLDANSDTNILHILTDLAGVDSGAGNNITQVIF